MNISSKYTKFAGMVIAAVFCLVPVSSSAEETRPKEWGFSLSGGFNHLFKSFDTADDLFAGSTNYPVADLQIMHFTTPENSDKFAEAYNYPTFGLGATWSGLNTLSYKEGSYLNNMVSLYGFVERDFYHNPQFSVGYDFRFGLGFTTSKYDPLTNPANTAIGSSVTFCIGAGVYLKWRPAPQLEIALRGAARHHSASRLCFPNFGLNEVGAEASVRYYLSEPYKKQTTHSMKKEFTRKMNYSIVVGGGIHHCNTEWEAYHDAEPDPAKKATSVQGWPKFFANFSATYRYALKFSSGVGVDAFLTTQEYMDSMRECDKILNPDRLEGAEYSPFSLGLSLVQNFHFRNFTIVGGVGVYLFKQYGVNEQLSRFYQRIGFRYDFKNLGGTFIQGTCKSHYFTRAEMLEIGFGVNI